MWYTKYMGILEFASILAANQAGFYVFDKHENRLDPHATTIRVRHLTSRGYEIALARI